MSGIPVEIPQSLVAYFTPDGKPTREGIVLFQKLVRAIEDLQARVTALEP